MCLSTHNLGTSMAIVSKFSGYLQGIQGTKNWRSWVEGQKIQLFGGGSGEVE